MALIKHSIAIVLFVLMSAGCGGSGQSTSSDLSSDVASNDDLNGSDALLADVAIGEVGSPPSVPTVTEIAPLPLADYGPAFWMEAEVTSDGLLEVLVQARDLTSLVGFATQITWSPDLLELVEVAATAPIGGLDAVAKGVGAGLGPGRLTMGVTRFPNEVDPWNPVPSGADLPGTVEMGRFVLRPIGSGDAVLRFREGHRIARRPDYAEIACAWAGVQVRIVSSNSDPQEVAK